MYKRDISNLYTCMIHFLKLKVSKVVLFKLNKKYKYKGILDIKIKAGKRKKTGSESQRRY